MSQRLMIGTNYKPGSQTFTTVGSHYFHVPPDVFLITAYCWGGGAQGHPANGSGAMRGGGGGGFGYGLVAVVPGTAYLVVVGGGGNHPAPGWSSGSDAGGTSYFIGSHIVAGNGGGQHGYRYEGGGGVGLLVINGANGGNFTNSSYTQYCGTACCDEYGWEYDTYATVTNWLGGAGGKAGNTPSSGPRGNGGNGGTSYSGGCYGGSGGSPATQPLSYQPEYEGTSRSPGGGGGGEAYNQWGWNGGAGARGEVTLNW